MTLHMRRFSTCLWFLPCNIIHVSKWVSF